MQPTDLLRVVGQQLERLGCTYFTTGSVASTLYGEPRFTNDVDIVVRLNEASARQLVAHFQPPEWYADADAAVEATRRHGMFNIIHIPSALKADLMVAAATPFNESRFARMRQIAIDGGWTGPFASPEDVILKKLEYFRDGGSAKHRRDIDSMVRAIGLHAIDRDYISRWSAAMQLDGALRQFPQLCTG